MTKKIKDPTLNALKNARKDFDKFRTDHRRSPTLEEFRNILRQSGFSIKEEIANKG